MLKLGSNINTRLSEGRGKVFSIA